MIKQKVYLAGGFKSDWAITVKESSNNFNWINPKEKEYNNGESFYGHVICKTPLGEMRIEWKSWKEGTDYGIEIDGKYIDTCYTLENAKLRARNYLYEVQEKLYQFLNS